MARKTTGKKTSAKKSKTTAGGTAVRKKATASARTTQNASAKKTTKKTAGKAKVASKTTTAKVQRKARVAKPTAKKAAAAAKSSPKSNNSTKKKKTSDNKKLTATARKKSGTGELTSKVATAKTKSSDADVKKKTRSASAKAAAASSKPAADAKSQEVKASAQSLRGKRTRSVAEAASAVPADDKGYVFINGRRVRMISTKGQLPIKKTRSNGSAETEKPPVEETVQIKNIKTKLSRKELNHYRNLLLLKRQELVGDLSAMEAEALRSGGGNISHMPIHMADIGTDTYDQDFMLGLAENERQQLREIDAALRRIEDRTYGVCQMTGKPIPKERLDAKPWAKYTIEAARIIESQWGR